MKYIIYGANRVAKDFIYIFDDLEILFVTDDIPIPNEFMGYRTKSLDEALKDSSYDQIILCDFDKTAKEEQLRKKGLTYGEGYLYEEDFFANLDEIEIPLDRKLAIWGIGNMAGMLMEKGFLYKIEIFIDSNKAQENFYGYPVVLPGQIVDWNDYFIIIAVARDAEIRQILFEKGLKENADFIGFQKVIGKPSDMLRQTIFDRSYYDLECNTMLNHLEILSEGNTCCCCTTFIRHNLDNVFEKDVDALWHSNRHKIMCLSTENKTYSFCDKNMCPLFVAKKNVECETQRLEQPYKKMEEYPAVLALGHDPSCNLSCHTCRKGVHFAKGEELERVNQISEIIKSDYLSKCKFLILAGDGEVFASPSYKDIYESENCNPDYIRLLSNGTLFTPSNWERLVQGKTGNIMLTVSIDAATKETYEKIRKNGNFDKLRQNMEFASSLRKSGALKYLRMNFVVQKENYLEMIPFVQWGEQLGVDEIFFTKILNWGTYTPEEFSEISMMEPNGITPKEELRKVLEHPVMQSSIVDLGTIQYFHKVDSIDVVENYYMWELEKRGGKLFS